ncbi:hypothetical protein VHEMI10387 [[Torrubiella] hemipterigena]|uniref:Uncharacterized protein n=1 Tax=[Torrubiella] hemipterigena TaxID=1531966 RepID=A0A0A1TRR8_9HYPO|nr:hypothetical protein VHEMI10387 [[Torrubiella] hemipterigena]
MLKTFGFISLDPVKGQGILASGRPYYWYKRCIFKCTRPPSVPFTEHDGSSSARMTPIMVLL